MLTAQRDSIRLLHGILVASVALPLAEAMQAPDPINRKFDSPASRQTA
jgi:hypothetical protein